MVWLMSCLELPSSRLRLTMELASGTAPTLSTSPTAGSSTSATMPMTPLATLPRSPMTALLPTQMLLSELATVLSAMPSLAPLLSPIPLLSLALLLLPIPLLLLALLLLLIPLLSLALLLSPVLLPLHRTALSAMVSVSVMVVPSSDKNQQQYLCIYQQ